MVRSDKRPAVAMTRWERAVRFHKNVGKSWKNYCLWPHLIFFDAPTNFCYVRWSVRKLQNISMTSRYLRCPRKQVNWGLITLQKNSRCVSNSPATDTIIFLSHQTVLVNSFINGLEPSMTSTCFTYQLWVQNAHFLTPMFLCRFCTRVTRNKSSKKLATALVFGKHQEVLYPLFETSTVLQMKMKNYLKKNCIPMPQKR